MNALKKYKFTGFPEARYIASEFALKRIAVTPQQYARVAGEYKQRLPNYEQREFRDQSETWLCRKRQELAAREYFQISYPLEMRQCGREERAHSPPPRLPSWKSPALQGKCYQQRLRPTSIQNMVLTVPK